MTARYTHPTTRRRALRPGDVVTNEFYPEWGQGVVRAQSASAGYWFVTFPGRSQHLAYARDILLLVERDGVTLSDRVEPA